MDIPAPAPNGVQLHAPGVAALREAAVGLETAFLAEMLKSAGLGQHRESLGGGPGEGQFHSFLVRAQAEQIARSGGIGLAEILFQSLMEARK
ncbi:rod-binding protein [Pontibaca salina]|uniref:Rod-binding protein n=1 Tax=Pontibaca salina TaxID=2795731 RepID=A0A934HPJ2_9RHOB|nr:rod-binding protein [Pontibaca salina]MBI6629372.1 rod-binding protein [Pontibaca salina]